MPEPEKTLKEQTSDMRHANVEIKRLIEEKTSTLAMVEQIIIENAEYRERYASVQKRLLDAAKLHGELKEKEASSELIKKWNLMLEDLLDVDEDGDNDGDENEGD